ncbi:glycosyltransferase family 2 protein [Parapedobacter soli]|uniref:glycosyltransferase family 2 protein n=1 Tax=Parapedobacter soli TaxID=416955 RepID=UPI0021C5E8C8|nr:glycosyltransferase family 2 protein [Parapedobacter soli]
MEPLVTVIIPTYNRQDSVVKAIESVRLQTYRNIQLIVVDDGSTDDTRELISGMEGLEYIYQKNQGQASARNSGLARARGTLLASLDSDDRWEPEFLEKCVNVLANNDFDFVFANWFQASPDGQWEDFFVKDPFLQPYIKRNSVPWIELDSHELRDLYLQACPSPSSSLVMRRSAIVSGWNKKLNIGDDWCLYLDMILSRPCRAAFTMEKLWYKGIDGKNIYDGRKRNEIVKLLLIEDTKEIMNIYGERLTAEEMDLLQKRYMAGLVEMAKHVVVRERNLTDAWKLFKQSFSIDTKHTLTATYRLALYAFGNRYRSLVDSLRSHK